MSDETRAAPLNTKPQHHGSMLIESSIKASSIATNRTGIDQQLMTRQVCKDSHFFRTFTWCATTATKISSNYFWFSINDFVTFEEREKFSFCFFVFCFWSYIFPVRILWSPPGVRGSTGVFFGVHRVHAPIVEYLVRTVQYTCTRNGKSFCLPREGPCNVAGTEPVRTGTVLYRVPVL